MKIFFLFLIVHVLTRVSCVDYDFGFAFEFHHFDASSNSSGKCFQVIVPDPFTSSMSRGRIITQLPSAFRTVLGNVLEARNFTATRRRYSRLCDLTWVRIGMPYIKDSDFPISEFQSLAANGRINRFPLSGSELNRKDAFAMHFMRMRSLFGSMEFDFHPESYLLPRDIDNILTQNRVFPDIKWIMKPGFGGQGRGIRLLPGGDQLRDILVNVSADPSAEWLVQRYIPNPLLINGTKFTVRLYVLITSLDPLRIYLHEEGVVKFCASAFNPESEAFDDAHAHMHITNEAFNKHHPSFSVSNDSSVDDQGSLSALRRYISRQYGHAREAALWSKIQHTVVKAILSVYPTLHGGAERYAPNHRISCFQLLGVDIDIDSDLKPWFIEANVNPSLGGSAAAFDDINKEALLNEVFDLTRILPYDALALIRAKRTSLGDWLRGAGLEIDVPGGRTDDALDQLLLALWEKQQSKLFTRVHPSFDPATRVRHSEFLQNVGLYNALLEEFITAFPF